MSKIINSYFTILLIPICHQMARFTRPFINNLEIFFFLLSQYLKSNAIIYLYFLLIFFLFQFLLIQEGIHLSYP